MAASTTKRKKRRRKGRKKKHAFRTVRLLLAAVLSVVCAFTVYEAVFLNHMNYGAMSRNELDCPKYIGDLHVTTRYLPLGYAGRTGKHRKIKYIAIHETDNTEPYATAEAHSRFLMEYAETEEFSWHYTVDENEVYHHLPDNERAYHAGDTWHGPGNKNAIGIELCVNEGSDFEQTLHNAAVLTAYLVKRYDMDLSDVKKHQDFSGKRCPATLIRQGRWEEFLGMVESELAAE